MLYRVNAGETRRIWFEFRDEMDSDDEYVTSASFSTAVLAGSDPNAASLIPHFIEFEGHHVDCSIGGAVPAGFQPGVIYRVTVTVITSRAQTLIKHRTVQCMGSDTPAPPIISPHATAAATLLLLIG